MSLIYGLTGTTNYEDLVKFARAYASDVTIPNGLVIGMVFVIVALLFKATAAPFHMWAPDVYEGSPTIVSTFSP